jgi:hypothetical protein
MSYWKTCWAVLCLLFAVSARAEDFQITAWRTAYDSELRCDPIATRNALLRLKEYHRFKLIAVSSELADLIDRNLASLVLPKPIEYIATNIAIVAPPAEVRASAEKRRRRKYANKRLGSIKKSGVNKELLLKDLLERAESAYQFGRLEEARRFFRLALKVKPGSDAAKAGLEKTNAEMK